MPTPPAQPAKWKDYPEPDFPNDKARAAYRKARDRIRAAWDRMQAGEKLTDLGNALADEGLTALPPEIGQLSALTSLAISHNQLSALPPEIGQLSALTILDISFNQLRELPPEIGQLTSLTILVLYHNQLQALPPELGQLTALTDLYLFNNQLRELPPEIGQLTALTNLSLFNNQLRELPPEIVQLTALTNLELSYSQLSELPPQIVQLSALTSLDLEANKITSLPPEIGRLSALTALNLTGNQLRELPASLRQLPRLKRLFLHDNPALKLSPTVLGADPRSRKDGFASAKSILDYYFGRQEGAARPLNEVKLILVGRGGAGKTSTVRALRGEPFHEGEESTPGIALCDWEMAGCKGAAVTAHVWDFAGQVITHALHQFFFSVRSLYVVVLTGRENNEREDAEYWLRLIKAFGTDEEGGPPVIVVLNKWDVPGCRPRLDRGALQERYPFIRGFVELDCKTGKGVKMLSTTLCREVSRLNWVREKFRESWDNVRRALAGGQPRRAHVSYAEYRRLCVKHGISDEGEQDSLAAILHRLGAALNYREDPRLRESTVLQPQWLTKNVYGLMRRAEKQSGLLRQADVEAVLRAEKDLTMRAYLVQLMERFEIAYAPKGPAGKVWLVPQALPDTQPKAAEAFKEAPDATRLRYTYPALPEGLVARAIVRLHDFIEENGTRRRQWASGAILTREGARALIRTEPQDRQVVITVTGPARERQQLAGLIQAEMRDIHGEIAGLSPQEETQVTLPGGDLCWVSTETLEQDEQRRQQTGIPTKTAGTVMVDPEQANNAYSKKPARTRGIWKPTVFISYSKSNVTQRKRLEAELKMLKNEGLLAAHWQDRMIDPGDDWDATIKREIKGADVILVLASSAALSTDYITEHEIPMALRLHRKKEAVVVPVILEACRWHSTTLGKLNALPEKGQPLNTWSPRSDGWKSLADGLAKLLKKLMAAKPGRRSMDTRQLDMEF